MRATRQRLSTSQSIPFAVYRAGALVLDLLDCDLFGPAGVVECTTLLEQHARVAPPQLRLSCELVAGGVGIAIVSDSTASSLPANSAPRVIQLEDALCHAAAEACVRKPGHNARASPSAGLPETECGACRGTTTAMAGSADHASPDWGNGRISRHAGSRASQTSAADTICQHCRRAARKLLSTAVLRRVLSCRHAASGTAARRSMASLMSPEPQAA